MRGSWRLNRTAIYWPPLLWLSALCLSSSQGLLNWRPEGPALCWMLAFSTTGCHQRAWSRKLTDFLSSPSYIIVQSPSQYLWNGSSSSGNNCHAFHRSLSSGASVYECTMGFYLVPYCQPSPPTRFLPITAIGMCHFLPVHHFGMACLAGLKFNIQHKNFITSVHNFWKALNILVQILKDMKSFFRKANASCVYFREKWCSLNSTFFLFFFLLFVELYQILIRFGLQENERVGDIRCGWLNLVSISPESRVALTTTPNGWYWNYRGKRNI